MRFNVERIFELKQLLRELGVGLKRLTFDDNFAKQTVTATLPSKVEFPIQHNLQSVPSYYIIGRQVGVGQITDGPTEWTADTIYLYNNGDDPVTATILIME